MIEQQRSTASRDRDLAVAAALACGTIFIGFCVYWIVQIQDVRELLALAYG